MSGLARLIDANANRAGEALRVQEDLARFCLDRGDLSGRFKALRHALREALDALPGSEGRLIASRDAAGDVGTGLSGSGEYTRRGVGDIALAAARRLEEALRAMEEAAKALADGEAVARRFEAMRYEAYEASRALRLALATGRARQWRLCVLLTESLCRRPWEEVAERAMDGGADCFQIREKDMEGGILADRTARLIELARPRGVSVIVNDRVDVALAAGADGVHLGQGDLTVGQVRRVAGFELLVGVSTHSLAEAEAAVFAGADYCGCGQMFPSGTKPLPAQSGPAYLRAYLARPDLARVPHLAIGGITPGNVGELAEAGCRGVAVSGSVCGAEQPEHVCRAIVEGLGAAEVGSTGP